MSGSCETLARGHAVLWHGDALEILARPEFPPCDLLATDPPYRLTSGGDGPSNWCRQRWDYDNSGALVACDLEWSDWLPLAAARLAERCHAYVMSNDRNLPAAFGAFADAGFGFHRLLTWNKRQATPNRWYMPNVEFCLFGYRGKARTIARPGSMAGVVMRQIDATDHPTEKPVALFQHWIENSCPPGGVVLDPFMGTGTTGVAALRAGRRFVGIELERRWFDVAIARIAAEPERPAVDLAAVPVGESEDLFAEGAG